MSTQCLSAIEGRATSRTSAEAHWSTRNKSPRVRSCLKKEQNQETYWCLIFAYLYWSTLSSYTRCVLKNVTLQKINGTKGNDKNSALWKIRLDICYMYEISYS